jgi:hypothetical protein
MTASASVAFRGSPRRSPRRGGARSCRREVSEPRRVPCRRGASNGAEAERRVRIRKRSERALFAAVEGVRFECALDHASFTSCVPPVTYTSLPEGRHDFAVRAVDAAGNMDQTPAAATWTIDVTPPETTITEAEGGGRRVRQRCRRSEQRCLRCRRVDRPTSRRRTPAASLPSKRPGATQRRPDRRA